MNGKKLKINGVPGFGFPGEQGNDGDTGTNILFSELYYEMYAPTIVRSKIPFDTNVSDTTDPLYQTNRYASPQNGVLVKPGDVIYISGNNGTTVHRISEDGKVVSTPMATCDFGCIPSFLLSTEVSSASGKYKISVSIESSFSNCFNSIIMYGESGKIYMGNYETGYIDNISEQSGTTVHIFALYKIAPMKYKKVLLGNVTLP